MPVSLPISRPHISPSSITPLFLPLTLSLYQRPAMPNAWSQLAPGGDTTQGTAPSQVTNINIASNDMNGAIHVRGWRFGDKVIVKAKMAVQHVTVAVPRSKLQDGSLYYLPHSLRVLPDATCELSVSSDFVLDEEQANALDKDMVAITLDTKDDLELYVSVPDLQFVRPVMDSASGEIIAFAFPNHNHNSK